MTNPAPNMLSGSWKKIYDYFEARNANIVNSPEEFNGIFGIQLYGKIKHNIVRFLVKRIEPIFYIFFYILSVTYLHILKKVFRNNSVS